MHYRAHATMDIFPFDLNTSNSFGSLGDLRKSFVFLESLSFSPFSSIYSMEFCPLLLFAITKISTRVLEFANAKSICALQTIFCYSKVQKMNLKLLKLSQPSSPFNKKKNYSIKLHKNSKIIAINALIIPLSEWGILEYMTVRLDNYSRCFK